VSKLDTFPDAEQYPQKKSFAALSSPTVTALRLRLRFKLQVAALARFGTKRNAALGVKMLTDAVL
jgi:hypothetical protein